MLGPIYILTEKKHTQKIVGRRKLLGNHYNTLLSEDSWLCKWNTCVHYTTAIPLYNITNINVHKKILQRMFRGFEEAISKIIAVLCTFWLFQPKINPILHMTISYIFVALLFAPFISKNGTLRWLLPYSPVQGALSNSICYFSWCTILGLCVLYIWIFSFKQKA